MCLYCVINMNCFAPPEEFKDLKPRYKKLALNYHPDKNYGNEIEAAEKFKQLAEAVRTLSDPILRQRYDATIGHCAVNVNKFRKPDLPKPMQEARKYPIPRYVPEPPPPPPPPSPPVQEPDYDSNYDDEDYDYFLSPEELLVPGQRKGANRHVKTAANFKEMKEAKKKKKKKKQQQPNAAQSRNRPQAATKPANTDKGLQI